MDEAAFLLRALASFAVAGTWISLSTLLAERLGTRVGGLIANLPSNIVVSLIFVASSSGTEFASAAARSVPLGMAIDTLFLLAFVALARKGVSRAIPASLAAWFAAAAAFAFLPKLGMAESAILFAAVALAAFALAEFAMRIRAVPRRDARFRLSALLVRAIFSGTVVATTVMASRFVPPYLTGIVATFPAVLLSTMTILTVTQGADFARATGKILLLSSSNIVVYALVAQAAFPAIGFLWGSLAAFVAAGLWVALLRPLLAKAG